MADTQFCRLAQKRGGGAWWRSCPTCGLSKTCTRGLEEVQLPNGTYEIRPVREKQPACERCRWWSERTNPWGECRRRAPVRSDSIIGRATNYTHAKSEFPETVRQDWCGEFEPAAKGEAS